ncbi:mitochondrial 37S ribosomal protein mS42 KNAG_0D01310 [Huiozyma naganishii CBS 8797]|uniref:Manganese/iron superoxide dismutase C-terminal domain-containing protein n=1 Tax=Huiozyma naganishii (strain ATCC MYA-139 / BCRC 22969 / CBS 8797 / KCTC 17520 / NBRC 10181 / NCYC 3082 / Yp74L-3) TaxID=1071383 RepID=J7RK50_HUIN7|nr:hypothetical protein KNAG_0D01310 [Kazachstania naganishii CBS 8797]CCK69883.1 hypothetical protein KNAG_0D01310 [Kazachstania naganishii CBS 8797]
MLRQLLCRRGIHTVPKLPNASTLIRNGIPPILSSQGFNTVWTDYQTYLCDKLTLATAGTTLESYYPFHIVLSTAKKSFQTHIFDIASAAHNNHLFIENILPLEAQNPGAPSQGFLDSVQKSFGMDWDSLKAEIVEQVEEKLMGQGWFFLVENSNKELHYLFLQNNGTPYYFPKNQILDMNGPLNLEEYTHLRDVKKFVSENAKVKDWTIPIIAVNLWDQAYLNDYGVSNRKQYLRNVLDNLNWSVVNSRLYSEQL